MKCYALTMHNIPIGVLGASGYAGRELCEIISRHPKFALAFATANEQRGQRVSFAGKTVTFTAMEDAPLGDAGLVFCALPHGASKEWVTRARAAGARVVDLSQDLRPGTGSEEVPYGLTELRRTEVVDAEVVANPGCYPTAILLALAPLLAEHLIPTGATISVSAASGVTGAGYSAKPEMLFAEITENFRAYSVGNSHRHLAEVRSVMTQLGGDVDILFTPHLLPVARGILATIIVPVTKAIASPNDLWRSRYRGERFIRIVDQPPSLRDVVRTNSVAISVTNAEGMRTPTLIVIAAIDNLVKGAAGQAVQNANLMLGIEESKGLIG
jgi:N-acetyl-gamma-glutamyl-phosphate reductase